MLAAVSPTTNLYEAVWNFETQDVYFSAQAGKIAVEFAELFEEEPRPVPHQGHPARPRRSLRGIQGPRHFPRRALPRAFRAVGKTTRRQQDVSRRMTAWGRRFSHPSRVRSYLHGSGGVASHSANAACSARPPATIWHPCGMRNDVLIGKSRRRSVGILETRTGLQPGGLAGILTSGSPTCKRRDFGNSLWTPTRRVGRTF